MSEARIATLRRLIIYLWIFALVLALWPYTANPVKPIKDLVTAAAALLLALSLLAWPEKPGEAPDWRKVAAVPIIGLWLGWSVVCALFSNHIIAGFDELRVFLAWFIIALFASRVFREKRHVKTLFLVICCAVLISNIYGFIQFMGWDFFPWATREVEEYRGLPSTYGNPNFAGHTLLVAIILGIGLASCEGMGWAIFLAIPPVVHLYLTHMRGSPVGLFAALLLCSCVWWYSRKAGGTAAGKAAAVLMTTAIIALVGVLLILLLSYARSGFLLPTDSSLILRYNGYYGASKMIVDRPLFGVGPAAYSRENIAYWTPYEQRWFANEQKRNMHVHNDLLETGVETGIPGLVLHITFLLVLLVRSLSMAFSENDKDRKRMGVAFAAVFMAFAVDGLFGFNLRVPVSGALFFLLAGALDGIAQPLAPSVVPLPQAQTNNNRKRKRKKDAPLDVPPSSAPAPPRLLFGLSLAVGAGVCVLWGVLVFVGENLYQRGQGARLFADAATNQAHRQQALLDAEALFTRGRRLIFWDARYTDALGHVAMRRGDMQAAMRYYLQSLRHDPHHPHTRVNMARSYLAQGLQVARDSQQGDYDQAASYLEEALRWGLEAEHYCAMSPFVQDAMWRIARARAVLAEQRGEDAQPFWHEVERRIIEALDDGVRDPSSVFRALAHAYVQTGRASEALPLFRRALPDSPGNAAMWNAFEAAAREAEEYEPLAQALRQALSSVREQKPVQEDDLVDIVRRLTICYASHLNQPGNAVPLVEQALALAPHRLELWGMFAGLRASPTHVNQVCDASSRYDAAPSLVADICAALKEPSMLARASQELARRSLQSSGKILALDLGGLADFIGILLEQYRMDLTRQAEVRANIATTYLEAGRWQEAEENFALAIDKLPANSRGRLMAARARALSNLGRNDEGLALIQHAVQLAPSDHLVQITHARFLRDIGRVDEAAFFYHSFINSLPEQSPVRAQAQQELDALTKGDERQGADMDMDMEIE